MRSTLILCGLLAVLCGCEFRHEVAPRADDSVYLQAQERYQAILAEKLDRQHEQAGKQVSLAEESRGLLSEIRDLLTETRASATLVNAEPDDEPLSPNVPLTEEEFADLQKSLQKSPPNFAIRWVTVDGESLDADELIGQWYRRNWTYPGTIDSHLIEHGVRPDEIRGWTQREKEQLHAAIHERERSQLQTAPRKSPPATVVRTYSVQSCPGGVCPAPSRRGLFGRRIR